MMCPIFFFKQKTAYDMRISDWSSDVCSSDLSGSSWWLSPGPAPLIQVPGLLGVPVLQHDQALHVRQVFFLEQECGSGPIFGDVHQLGTVDRQYALARTQQAANRSEEHTSELQSLMRISYAVFCLKKKKKKL